MLKRWTAVLLSLALLFSSALAMSTGPLMRLHQIARGHTDCYLITVEDTVVLVDCGVDTDVNQSAQPLLDYLEASGIDHVDAHFVTHWHDDHAYLVNTLNERYGLDSTVVYGASPLLPARFQPLAHGQYRQLRDGDSLSIGPLQILCVGPESPDVTGENNRDSLNFLVYYGNHRFLFTGDWVDYTIRQRHEHALDKIDVLSFPHHGLSPMCIKPATMRHLSPRVILIPGSGANEDKVKAFALKECSLKRYPRFYSCRDGHVHIISDGTSLWSAYNVEPGVFPSGKLVP